ncbi:MAG: 50S ribosomal protein L9 [Olsenella sp.]|jgi:large subunit ribosomal protein L9|nr:50S ribosomal protein L9 [Olsenella sp.]MCI1288940.1 50S ribosomal protein L9 [Olsenella sp.]
MKVILLGELRGKGGEGDIVEVAQGYAENYLFPQRIAQPATPGNIKQLEERRHNIEKREEKRIADANATKAKLDGQSVTIDAKVGENDQLFGAVTAAQIADAIKDQLGVEVDRKRISTGGAIKTAGAHVVDVNFYREIGSKVTVLVGVTAEAEAEEEPAEETAEAEAEQPAAEESAE